MGRQVNFFMHPDDLKEFQREFLENSSILSINSRSKSSVPEILETTQMSGENGSWLQIFLVQKENFSEVKMQYIKDQNYWMVDDSISPVIEFDRCYFDEKILRRGRIYFQTGFYDMKEKWKERSEEFIKWADSLLRWIRKKYKRDARSGFYIGHYAEKWNVSISKGIIPDKDSGFQWL